MGSVYAGLLADAGHDVVAVDTWTEHIEAINSGGLRVEGASGDRTVPLAGAYTNCASAAEIVGTVDVAIVATKVPQVGDAVAELAPLLAADTPVISIQNGLGGPGQTAAALGDDRVVIGVVGGFGASMRGPGHVHHNGMELVRLGEYAGDGVTARVDGLAAVWTGAGFNVAVFDNVHQLVWEKLIANVAFSAPCTVTELRVGELLDDPDGAAISAACATEAHAVAVAKGIPLNFDDPVAYTREFGAKIPNARPSMLLDWLAGRPCEIDAINGAIPPEGAGVGVATPANAVVSSIVRARERHRYGL